MFDKWVEKFTKRVICISKQTYTPGWFSLERLLVGISYLYGLGVKIRCRLYEKGYIKQKNLPCSVISIGNMVVGGTGKTPMAIYVADLLTEMGKKTVVISRGYRGRYTGDAHVVSDGSQVFSSPDISGDEPYMMARRLSFPVIVGKDRFKAGLAAIRQFKPDVIVLDDGFQHMGLARDLDLVLFDYHCPLGNNRLLPAGRLRESFQTAGRRIDALVFTRCPVKPADRKVPDTFPARPWFKSRHQPFVCHAAGQGAGAIAEKQDLEKLKGTPALVFSGLADNEAFHRSLEDLGINILHHLEFEDHYRYKNADVSIINQKAVETGASIILTTEKDWIKLDPETQWTKELMVIGIQIVFEHPEKIASFLRTRIEMI